MCIRARAKAQGLPCDKVRLYSASHATYYPGATNMSIKVVFSPQDGKILGAQIVGFEGVEMCIRDSGGAGRGFL